MDDSEQIRSMAGPTRRSFLKMAGLAGTAVVAGYSLVGCSTASNGSVGDDSRITILAGENEYGDVAAQIGGSHVNVTSIISDPGADPHDFEATPSDVKLLSNADIVMENGLGYDDWLDEMLTSYENPDRKVISAQEVLGLADDTDNPHLWYDPQTMPAVADALADALESLDPGNAADYRQNLTTFQDSMNQYTAALSAFQQQYPNISAAATEPVANYLLEAAGIEIKTPWSLQSAIMNSLDPSAQDMSTQMALFTGKAVDVFVYNEQVTSSLTEKWLDAADGNSIPVVAVYETMPTDYHYVEWMLAEINALTAAVSQRQSTTSL